MHATKTVYQWREGFHDNVSARVAGKEIDRIRKRNGGMCEPGHIVEAARPTTSPIHAQIFDVDEATAAHEYYLEKARYMIRGLVEVNIVQGEERLTPAFIHVRDAEGNKGYLPAMQVLSDEDLRRQAVAAYLSQLRGLQSKYDFLRSEFGEWFDATDRLLGESE
jgi:hypothetical protein